MIKNISKMKDFGVFHDYSWNIKDCPEFKRFNLIYGWNRSGKTTLSRVFESCEKKSLYQKDAFSQFPSSGVFELSTVEGEKITSSDIVSNTLSVRVFNQDFINDNISFNDSESCKPIFYVSEEDILSSQVLEKLKNDKETIEKDLEAAKKNRELNEKIRDNFLTSLGREVYNIIFDRSYTKAKAENRINSIGADNFGPMILAVGERKGFETISKSEAPGKIEVVSSLSTSKYRLPFLAVKALLDRRVVSELLERLKDPHSVDGALDEELNSWVKSGLDIHKSRDQYKKCLFCENEIDNNLFDTLAKHFSKDYEELQGSIGAIITTLQGQRLVEIPENIPELYPDLKPEYTTKVSLYNKMVVRQNEWISSSITLLELKSNNPFDSDISEMITEPLDHVEILNKIIDQINIVILKHNEMAENHQEKVRIAKEALELHIIASALEESNFSKIEKELFIAKNKEEELLKAMASNDDEIAKLEKRTSSIAPAITKINKNLLEFFGREEIKLELDEDKKGYIIRRVGLPASTLSEGEKTAIAFSYFVAKVEEKGFVMEDSIVFIDDPISSFDSNFVYHCFSLISTRFKNVSQLFIATHNFQLFNLVKEWFSKKNRSAEQANRKLDERQVKKPMPCEFFMVENFVESDIRKGRLIALEKTLLNFKSEYHFLFHKLKTFSEASSYNYEDFYTVGNMARRFFDIFADFKIPAPDTDQKSKMDMLIGGINQDEEVISPVDSGKAYKLVNDFSHNSDPTSAIEHKDKGESADAIKVLLRIVKESDPRHYDILEENAS